MHSHGTSGGAYDKGKRRGVRDSIVFAWSRAGEWIWIPSHDIRSKPQQALQAAVRIFWILIREFQKDAIMLRSSALTYAVVLSMVPMLALGTAVLKGLGAGDQMREAAYQLIAQFDPSKGEKSAIDSEAASDISLTLPSGDTASVTPEEDQEDLVSHLRTAVDTVFDYVEQTNFATIGAFGILGLVLAVISVLGRIEKAMNVIWGSESGRPFGRRVLDYLALMILLPVSINVGLAATATLQSSALLAIIHKIIPVDFLVAFLLQMVPVAVLVATFAILYRFLPNVRVRMFPALVGGCFGGVGWLAVQGLYVHLQIGVAKYNAIYGSFATLPLFLIWIYVGWVVFLTGAEMAFAVQNWHRYLPSGSVMTPKARVALAFDILAQVFDDFRSRRVSDLHSLAERLERSDAQVGNVLGELIQAGLLRRTDDPEGSFVPAAPQEEIFTTEVLDTICGEEAFRTVGGSIADEAFGSMRIAMEERPLAGEFNRDVEV